MRFADVLDELAFSATAFNASIAGAINVSRNRLTRSKRDSATADGLSPVNTFSSRIRVKVSGTPLSAGCTNESNEARATGISLFGSFGSLYLTRIELSQLHNLNGTSVTPLATTKT